MVSEDDDTVTGRISRPAALKQEGDSMAKGVQRYILGDKQGTLQGTKAKGLRAFLKDRSSNPEWVEKYYPVIYQLVPISPVTLRRRST